MRFFKWLSDFWNEAMEAQTMDIPGYDDYKTRMVKKVGRKKKKAGQPKTTNGIKKQRR